MPYQWDNECRALLLPGEKELEVLLARRKYAAPELFQVDSAPKQFWLNCFQNTLHTLLEHYLNGTSLSVGDRLLRRPMRQPSGSIQSQLQRAWHLALDKLHLGEPSQQHSNGTVAQQLVKLYELLSSQLENTGSGVSPSLVSPATMPEKGEPSELSAIRKIAAEPLRGLQSELLVQGSVGTGEQIGYSDLDLWLVVSREALSHASHLESLASVTFRIQRSLYDFDPLQHHGVMLASEVDFASYPESFLPLDALGKARFLCPSANPEIAIRPRDARLEASLAFFGMLAVFRNAVHNNQEFERAYQTKCVLSYAMLLPSLFEGAQGRPCFKGDSFAKVRSCTPEALWSIVEELSQVRQDWRYAPSIMRRVLQRAIRNPFLLQYLMQRGLSGKLQRTVNCRLPDDWQARTLEWAEFLWEKLCKSSTT